jgi:hypothetical protein
VGSGGHMRLARPVVVGLSVLLCAMALPVLPAVAGQPHPPKSATASRQFGAHLYRMNAHADNWVSSATTLPGPLGAHLIYYGRRVVSHMQVVQVIYGSGSYASFVTSSGAGSMAAFYQGVLNSPYYSIFFPHGKTITQGGTNSCQAGGFVAYHGTIAAGGNPEVYYGGHPHKQTGSGCEGQGGAPTAFGDRLVRQHER